MLPEPEPLQPFKPAQALRMEAAERARPPRRMMVDDAAARYRILHNPGGGYSGPWRNDYAPYLREVMNATVSRAILAVIFVGPAQCGKTDGLIINPLVHSIMCDPADTLIVQTSEAMSRDFSRRRIDRLNAKSPRVRARLERGKGKDNVFDKRYLGMMLSFGHPAIGPLSGRPIPRVYLTDYDRMPDDIENEGSPFDLAQKRTRTFGSRAITVAESSPGREITDGTWEAKTAHEAPPTTGILALYNRGDRRRWYWPCPECGEFFIGRFEHMEWPDEPDPEQAALAAVMICPANGCVIEPAKRTTMNEAAHWLAEGQTISPEGKIRGQVRRSETRSYWLNGPAATWQTWRQMVASYLIAKAEYDRTGDEGPLKVTVTTDQAEAYLPRALAEADTIEAKDLIERAEGYKARTVPAAARFITVSVDVQKHHFQVLVRAFGEHLESWVIDYFRIFKPAHGDRMLEPALRIADWNLLLTLAERAYPIEGEDGLEMLPARIVVDSGGMAGVTDKAYQFHRKSRRTGGAAKRFWLTKGTGLQTAPRVALKYPDADRKDRKVKARGEIPVLMFNTTLLKDELDAQLRLEEVGPRFVHLPKWLVAAKEGEVSPWFEEVTAEQRDEAGAWKKVKPQNEALDLMVMAQVAALSMKGDRINWTNPPAWASEAATNPLIREIKDAAPEEPAGDDQAAPEEAPAPAPAAKRPKRGGGWMGGGGFRV